MYGPGAVLWEWTPSLSLKCCIFTYVRSFIYRRNDFTSCLLRWKFKCLFFFNLFLMLISKIIPTHTAFFLTLKSSALYTSRLVVFSKIPQIRWRGPEGRKLNKKLFKMVFMKKKTNNVPVENKSAHWNPFWWQLRMQALQGTWAPSLPYLLSVIIYLKQQTQSPKSGVVDDRPLIEL